MSPLEYMMVQTCTISHTSQDQKLSYVSGTSAFLPGKMITGSQSGSTGLIKSVVVESGSWSGGNASGYLILSPVSGQFKVGEIIRDNQAIQGVAVVSGSLIPQTDEFGTPYTTTTQTTSKCWFSESSNTGGILHFDSGDYIMKSPLLFLPASTVIEEGDQVEGEISGYSHTYEVLKVTRCYRLYSSVVDHIEAELKAVGKRNG